MNSLLHRLGKTLSIVFIVIGLNTSVKAQTVLVTGDIAFSGYIANAAVPDQFSFVLLKAVTNTTVIKFTDIGWRTVPLGFNSGAALESEITFTATSAMAAGTEIIIDGVTATKAGGGSAGTIVYSVGAIFSSPLSFASTGDQLFAYQGTFAAPTFIAGIHMNVEAGTTAGAWDGPAAAITGQTSEKPAALTTGTNALWFIAEWDNARFNCGPDVSTAPLALAALTNTANWTTNNTNPPGFTLPTGCNYLGIFSAPVFTLQPPVTTTICAGAGTSFTVAATGAVSYQWQVDNGGGFVNLINDATYSGVTTVTLTITNAPVGLNGYLYRAVATNGAGSTNSNNATLNVTPLPVNPTILAKIPATVSVADGTPVSATFNPGSGGTTCTDDYRFTTNGGGSYSAYIPGTPISTIGLSAGTGWVFIEGRRAGCASLCQNSYIVLAAWYVTPLPAGATTLAAGDIAFSGYTSTTAGNDFSFVLLKNIGPGTVINFTDNGWIGAPTNAFRAGEQNITWTSNAAYPAGTEIMISGTTATLAAGGSAGTVTGTALSLVTTGDQILAFQGTIPSPVFISGIHMNVFTTGGGDPVSTTAAAWDGGAFAPAGTANASALPPGLITGTNAIWIGTLDVIASEFDNARYGDCAGPGTLGPINTLRAALNNQSLWIRDNLTPPGFLMPTGCQYFGLGTPPNFTLHPLPSTVCAGTNTSFTAIANGAITYQWQVDNGGGFVNLSNDAVYSGVTTTTLTITATPFSLNGYLYRSVATNASGSTNSNSALLTVNAVPVRPTLLAKIPASNVVADGTPVSATFNAGSGGTGCLDDFRYTIDGGTVYLPYTPGSPISTTGLAAGSGFVFIEGRRANCASSCQGTYEVLASWRVNPLPVAPTTLNAGDIAFSGYASTAIPDEFSFVLLRNIGPGTVINFTDNGFQLGVLTGVEQTITWTAPAGGLPGGTEIKISGLTATRSGAGAAGTVTGTALSLTTSGDQILAYRGTAGSPTFISAIHMNVFSTTNGDPISTTAAAWDGASTGTSASALPTGLTTGVNAIWIGTQDVIASEFDNSRYGNCSGPGVLGPLTGLRAALNNQANWISDNNTPPSFTLPTGCNYLSVLCPVIIVTNPVNTAGTAGTAFSETFTSSGGAPVVTYTTASTLPTGLTLSSAGVLSGTPTQAGTFPIVVTATDAGGCTGVGPTYNLVISCPAPITGIATPSSQTVCSGVAITTIVLSGAPVGAVYNWTRDNNVAVTGIAASGSGNISGTLTNTTAAPVTVTFTITATYYGTCVGTAYTATVLVNPTPNAVATPSSQTICSGSAITTIVLSGAVGGTVFNWTRDNTVAVTGIAASGAGNISGSLTNTTNAPVTVTFTITPTANGCAGTPITATVLVNPIPSATATPSSQTTCSGATITTIVLSGSPVAGTVYNWVRDNNATVTGIAASGAGNISGALTNTTAAPITVTFTITPTANSCPGAAITATVLVNPSPAAFAIGGAGIFCPPGTTLTGPVDPNYTYQWGRSLFTAPFTNMGTAQSQVVTASGIYQLVVTNQFACSATDTAVVNVADYVYNGSIGAGDPQQTGRINRFAVISTCAAPKACPGLFTAVGARFYDAYTITNVRNVPVCATIGVNSGCSFNIFSVAYLTSFNPASLCTNYLGDPGSSPTNSIFYEVTIPANGTIVVVVHEVNVGAGCGSYTLTVDVPREPAAITVTPSPTVCNGTPITLTASAANTYLWSPGGATTQSIVQSVFGTVTYTVTLGYGNTGCTATASQTVSVFPTPDATATPSSQTSCSGNAITTIVLTGTVPGTTFNWTRDNTVAVTGIAANGSGDIAGTLTNTTTAPVTVTFTITPTANGCFGTPITATVIVNPTPDATATPSAQTICSGSAITTIALTGSIPGTVFSWTRDNNATVIGIGSNGSGDIAGTLTNTTTAPVTVTFTITPSFTNAGVTCTGTPVTATVIVNPIPNAVATPASQTSCSGSAITTIVLSGNVAGTVYNWTRDNTVLVTGIAASGSGDISGTLTNTTNAPITVTFTITPSFTNGAVTCTGSPITATVVVNPSPNAVATPASQTICSGSGITTIVLTGNVPGTVYNWTRDNTGTVTGIGASGTGDISGVLVNTTNAAVTVTFTITPSYTNAGVTCTGTPITATVVVNPIPNAVATPSSQTICSGSTITTIVLTGNVAGTVFNWTRNNTATVTGIAANGSGNISGSLTNTTNAPITVTFTITPSYTNAGVTCTGAPINATVVVNPIPNAVAAPTSQTICSGSTITNISISGNVIGTVFNWTRDNTVAVTGIAASGSGDISGSLTNTTNAPVTVTFTITPSYTNAGVTCTGTPITSTVLVNPIPNAVATPASQTICSGNAITTIVLTGAVAGTTFNWTRDNSGPVPGIAASGSGNISGVLTNLTNTPRTVIFTITPTANGCFGTPITATVLVNPTPNVVAAPPNQSICSGNSIITINLNGSVSGTIFNWTRDNTVTVTGIAASGSGNISGSLTNTTNAPVTVTFTITPTANGCPGPSTTATVLVYPTPNAVATPATQTICSGNTITTIVLSGAVAGTTFSWTRDNLGTVTGIPGAGNGNISGALTSNVTTQVTVTFTITPRANGCDGLPITATVVVNPIPTITCPANIVINATAGTCAVIVNYPPAVVTGVPAPTVTYSIPSGSSFPVGVTTVTVTASNICGTVSCSFTITVLDVRVPFITTQPVDRSVCVGGSTTFTVVATNTVSYQWQTGNGNSWSNIAGATSATLVLNNITMSMNNDRFRVALTGPCGTVVYSNEVRLTVNPLPLVTLSSASNPVMLPNSTLTITASVSPAGGTFVWLFNGTPMAGVTGSSLGPLTVLNVGTYTVIYTDPNGCVSTSLPFKISAGVTDFLWVYPNPNTGQFNVRFYNVTGETATLKIFNYMGQLVHTQTLVLGVAYSNFLIDMRRHAAGVYTVKIMNGSGAVMAAKRLMIYHP